MISMFTGSFAPIYGLIHLGLGIVGAYMVYNDARKREVRALDLAAEWWAAAVVAGPVVGIAVYWLMHYSSFAEAANKGS